MVSVSRESGKAGRLQCRRKTVRGNRLNTRARVVRALAGEREPERQTGIRILILGMRREFAMPAETTAARRGQVLTMKGATATMQTSRTDGVGMILV